jgi:hypothetical protein
MRELLDETVARYPRETGDDRGEWWIAARLGGTAPKPEDVGEAGF